MDEGGHRAQGLAWSAGTGKTGPEGKGVGTAEERRRSSGWVRKLRNGA